MSRGSLAATLKRARLLTSQKITMDDVKKWRLENTNKEKKTDRKSFNSWVANTRKEEYQVDLFFFQDLKKKQAMQELMEERAKAGDKEAQAAIAADIPVSDAFAQLTGAAKPKAKQGFSTRMLSKLKPKAKAKAKVPIKELRQRIKDLTWDYESGLLAVDTFTKMVAVVPMKDRKWETVRPALEKAFKSLGGKPHAIFSDAASALTSGEAAGYFHAQKIVHNIVQSE